MGSTPRGLVVVRIDDEHWDGLDEDDRRRIVGWGFVIAGESVMEGSRSGPVFTGMDGGVRSPHVGRWELF